MIRVLVPPTVEHITVDEARRHLHLDTEFCDPTYSESDDWLTLAIVTAREHCEGLLERSISEQTLEVYVNSLCGPLALPRGPVLSVLSAQYMDESGTWQSLAHQFVDAYESLLPEFGGYWPTTAKQIGCVKVRYVAGYTAQGESPSPAPLPRAIRHAMLLIIGHLYENREQSTAAAMNEIPMGVHSLLEPYRYRKSMA